MEGLIPFVIMLILGALFNSGKKKVSEEKSSRQNHLRLKRQSMTIQLKN